MRLLEGKGVSKHFGGLVAVSNVDFHVDEGEILGLIGPNGAGKTTLFNLISGALPLGSGSITFNKCSITNARPHNICKMGVARTFQSVKVFRNMTVEENVLLACLFGSKMGREESKVETARLLDFMGLSAYSHVMAKDLTLGRQKRLEVARALATRPQILLLDELMAGLNPAEIAEAMELVNKIRENGVSIVMIEHVMKAIMGVCDRIIVLHHGEKIADGPPEEIAHSKTVVEVYLGA